MPCHAVPFWTVPSRTTQWKSTIRQVMWASMILSLLCVYVYVKKYGLKLTWGWVNDDKTLVFMWTNPFNDSKWIDCVFLEILLEIFLPVSLFLSLLSSLSGCQERVSGCVFGGIVVRAMRRSSLYFVVMATLATWYPLHVRLKHPISWYFMRSCTRSFLWVLSQHNHVLSRLVWETCAHTQC